MTGRVRVLPLDVEFVVEGEESVFSAAVRQGLRWPTVCGGQGTCRTCYFEVVEGSDSLRAPAPAERAALRTLAVRSTGELRLACQTRVDGRAVAWRLGVRRK